MRSSAARKVTVTAESSASRNHDLTVRLRIHNVHSHHGEGPADIRNGAVLPPGCVLYRGHARLAAWFERFEARPSMQATLPRQL